MIDIIKVESEPQIRQVANMAYKIWNEYYTPLIGKEQVDYMLSRFQNAKAIDKQIQEGYHYFLATYDDEPAGYFAITIDETHSSIFLSKLYVDRGFRNRGVGKTCIAHVEAISRKLDLDGIWLTVNKGNDETINIYEKLGFVNMGSIIQDIGNGFIMDDYRMEKKL